ncbi:MAG: UvrD-helicase domain-containing protein [Desulfovibrio sp.]|nr:UvrD-helicase domain-containing protein [Desulfovibrio sp.]
MCRLRQVKASAGAGKTQELTRCFLQRMLGCDSAFLGGSGGKSVCTIMPGSSDSLEGILAVTFTNASAAEMRDRVLRSLKNAALGKPGLPFPMQREMAAQWLDEIMRNMSALNIRTIDSLLHLIVRVAALELGLHPDFQPVFTTEEALTPYLDILLDRAWQGDEDIRRLLRNVYRTFARREKGSGFLAGDRLLRALRPLLDDVLADRFGDLDSAELLHSRLDEMLSQAITCAEAFRAISLAQGLVLKKDAQTLVDVISAGGIKDSAYLYKSDASSLFLKKNAVNAGVQFAFEAFVEAGRRLVKEVPVLRQALDMEPLLALARTLSDAFVRNQRDEGCLPIVLVPRMARDVLEGTLGVPDALCRLGTRLTHFLVDEFQDTSREQWLALRLLVLEALSRGGTMTWVGDVKQSIYGWRGGEPELFDGVFDDVGLTNVAPGGLHDNLPYNWRSRHEIVCHNNSIFGSLARKDMAQAVMKTLLPSETPPEICREFSAKLARAFTGTEQKIPPGDAKVGGLVQVDTVHTSDAGALTEGVLAHLCALLRENIAPASPWSDVLVLVRWNDQATSVATRLASEGIPVITENSLLLAKHPLVRQTVDLLSFLDNPDDNIAFMSLINGVIFKDHPEAAELQHENLEAWCVEAGTGALYLHFRHHWPKIWRRLLEPFFNHSGLTTPYDITLAWYDRLQVEQRFPEAESFLRRFMEVVYSAEEKGLGTLSTFLEHWHSKGGEEKVPMPESMDAVRVMTIHKSKGLEAPIVILPWTNWQAKIRKEKSAPVLVQRNGLRFIVSNQKELGQPYYRELARQCCENMHMLYVAFTRARDALYIFRTTTEGSRGGGTTVEALDLLMKDAGLLPPYVRGRPIAEKRIQVMAQGGSGKQEAENNILNGACLSDTGPDARDMSVIHDVQKEALDTFDKNQDSWAKGWRPMHWLPQLKIFRNPLAGFAFRPEDRGNLLHVCLEHLRCSGVPDDDAQAALRFGIDHYPLPMSVPVTVQESVYAALRWFASQPEAQHWLREGWPEHSLMDATGHVLRTDLLVNEKWGSLVLEYKSGQREEAHIAQVRAYLKCLAASGVEGTPRGLLVYLDLKKFILVDIHAVSEPVENCAMIFRTGDANP